MEVEIKYKYKPKIHKEEEFKSKGDFYAYQLIELTQERIQEFWEELDSYLDELPDRIVALENKKIIIFRSWREPHHLKEIEDMKKTLSELSVKREEFQKISEFLAQVVDDPFEYDLHEICQICIEKKWSSL